MRGGVHCARVCPCYIITVLNNIVFYSCMMCATSLAGVTYMYSYFQVAIFSFCTNHVSFLRMVELNRSTIDD